MFKTRFCSVTQELRGTVEEMHRRLWPGWEVPTFAVSKSTPFARRADRQAEQKWWLPQTALPTSLVVAYLTWGMSHWKRASQDRMVCARNVQKLLSVLACSLSTFDLRLYQLGSSPRRWRTVTVDSTLVLPPVMWPDGGNQTVLAASWWVCFNREDHNIQSSFDRPFLADFLLFCLEPTNASQEQVPDQVSLALCILTQIAQLLDEHAAQLSRTRESIHRSRGVASKALWRHEAKDKALDIATRLWFHPGFAPWPHISKANGFSRRTPNNDSGNARKNFEQQKYLLRPY